MNQRLAFVLFAFAFIVAIVVGLGTHEDLKPAPAEFRAKFNETLIQPLVPSRSHGKLEKKTEARTPASSGVIVLPQEKRMGLTREAFEKKYGEKFEITFFEKRVIRVDGSAIASDGFDRTQKVSAFRTSSASAVSLRAREILDDLRYMLGAPSGQEFMEHAASTGESSAQITFQQAESGIPVYPGGLVTILLGPDGEVRSVDSSVYTKLEIVNASTLPRPEEAREILFVTQSAPIAVLHHAYETRDRGIQTVTDAQTGAVLLEKNRRVQ